MNFSTVPPCRSSSDRSRSWYGRRIASTSSGSRVSDRAVNPTRSAKSTVMTLRSLLGGWLIPASAEPLDLVAEAAQGLEQHRAVVLVPHRQRQLDLALVDRHGHALAVVIDGDHVRPLLRHELEQLDQLARTVVQTAAHDEVAAGRGQPVA